MTAWNSWRGVQYITEGWMECQGAGAMMGTPARLGPWPLPARVIVFRSVACTCRQAPVSVQHLPCTAAPVLPHVQLRLQLEAAEAQCGELRRQVAELEGRGQGLAAALAAAEGRAAEAEEALASRGTAHAQQVRSVLWW